MKEESASPVSDPRNYVAEGNLSKGLGDVGHKAWSTVLGGFLVAMVTFGYTNAFGVYQDFYTRSGAASPSRISWIGSIQMFLLLAMSLPAGKLLDMGHFRQTTVIGSILYVFSLFMLSIAHTDKYYQIFLSQGVGMGIGAGLIYLPAVAVQSRHWQAHRSSLGSILFPIMLNQLFKNPSVGFEWGVRASAFLVLGLLIIGNLLMSDNQPDLTNRPKPDMKHLMTDVPYWLSILACILINMDFYIQLFGIVHGVDENTAFYFLAILSAASLPGRLLPNIVADRFGPLNTLLPCVGISGAMIFALYGTLNVGSLMAFAIIYGFFSGALGPPSDGQLIGIRNFVWSKAIIFSGVIVLAGFALLVIVRSMQTRRKSTKLV
ncbi:major facilitator superfamily domain-containing protein [Rhodocollybia butyracea]|uniref:Major facilitator superfamily domain-containing protein n=1 Tax=Rhodocollybia butyracea TaxID=206335 RepID=A0A9P5PVQ2_9AGAR|nr:major facilitator superfamily domain-containing protein [Rhodocollybia butyracea]